LPCLSNFYLDILNEVVGIFVAFIILIFWFSALGFALTQVHLSAVVDVFPYLGLILIIQFLHMGLFMTVHDACHGSVAPGNAKLNLWIGRLFAFLYAGFSFDYINQKHHDHHRFSGTDLDPDFHAQGKPSFFFWVFRFLKQYITVKQILIMCGVAQILMHGFHLPEINVLTFWALPSVLSSLQLFYFGTYLPHRKSRHYQFEDAHHTRNFSIPKFLSLVSCYHFGAFHHTHHKSPGTPWFFLPKKQSSSSPS